MSTGPSSRTYGGKTAGERRDERRLALVEAARALWVDQGWAAVTMRGVCSAAGLSDRYFYESFSDRDALLLAVAEELRDQTVTRLIQTVLPRLEGTPSEQLRAALTEVVRLVSDDESVARILFGDHAGSAVLENMRRETLLAVVDLFVLVARPNFFEGVDEAEFRVHTLIGLGGFVESILVWRAGVIEMPADRLVEVLQAAGESLGGRFVPIG